MAEDGGITETAEAPPDKPPKENSIPSPEAAKRKAGAQRKKSKEREKPDGEDEPEDSREDDEAAYDQREAGDLMALLKKVIDDEFRALRLEQRRAYDGAFRNLALPVVDQHTEQNIYLGLDRREDDGLGRPLPDSLLARVQSEFVEPDGYRQAWTRLESKGLIILTAPRGSGRTYSSYHLLDAVCARGVRELTAHDLPRLDRSAAEDTGFVCAEVPPEMLDAHRLGALAERLRERRCRAVLIADRPAGAWPTGIAGYVARLDGRPRPEDIVRRYLAAHATELDDAGLDAICADPKVVAVLHSFTPETGTLGGIADFAGKLLGAHRGELALDEACAQADRADDDLAEWFHALTMLEEKAFAIALAVLNNQPLPVVADASRTLTAAIRHAERPDKAPPSHAFRRTTAQLLRVARAGRCAATDTGEHGDYPVELIRSERADYPQRMVTVIWREYPELQPLLVKWLGHLSIHGRSPRVRAQAATVVGLLAEMDFAGIYHSLLRPWGDGFREEHWDAVAAALRVSALNPALRDTVWTLLERWGDPEKVRTWDEARVRGTAKPEDKEPPRYLRLRRHAVAAALGASVGPTDLPRALEILGKQADSPNYGLMRQVCRAMADLFSSTGPAGMALVFQTLAEWAVSTWPPKVETALTCFVQILIDLDVEDLNDGPTGVLDTLDCSPELRRTVARLWRRAINIFGFEVPAMKALRHLVEAAERSPDHREPLCRLVTAIPSTPRDHRVLQFHLQRLRAREECEQTSTLILGALAPKESESHAYA
ncbi:hypothetical protein [Catenuloplanes atrovinosus]|uniref:Uncharacterized protein n=1 Tax=Catenuloplanes atrovinosus TaxID=137266 RepID=A0AAE4CAV2_9ACTN|nr:hypothetical protein [Catenuloplanes atrovinosus]MDR7277468.1 hypothetical protein [Catenuloplanes atrovinosus]